MLLDLKVMRLYYSKWHRTLLLGHFIWDSNLNLGVPSSNNCFIVVTITHFTIQNGYTALNMVSFKGYHKVVELLLTAGANPDLQHKVRTGTVVCIQTGVTNMHGRIKSFVHWKHTRLVVWGLCACAITDTCTYIHHSEGLMSIHMYTTTHHAHSTHKHVCILKTNNLGL